MPFTLVHPAAVLPLVHPRAGGFLVPSALVLGTMAPDLPYFVSLQWIGGDYNLTLTHTTTSLLWLDPAIALVLVGVFHALLRRPLTALLPQGVAARMSLEPLPWRSPRTWAAVVLSVLIGAATHVGWDAAADAAGYAWSTRLNLLSDVLGGAALIAAGVLWWRSTTPCPAAAAGLAPATRTRVLAAVVVLPVLWGAGRVASVAGRVADELRDAGDPSRSALADVLVRELVTQGGTALGVVVLAYAGWWHLARPDRRPGPGRGSTCASAPGSTPDPHEARRPWSPCASRPPTASPSPSRRPAPPTDRCSCCWPARPTTTTGGTRSAAASRTPGAPSASTSAARAAAAGRCGSGRPACSPTTRRRC